MRFTDNDTLVYFNFHLYSTEDIVEVELKRKMQEEMTGYPAVFHSCIIFCANNFFLLNMSIYPSLRSGKNHVRMV